MIIFVLMLIINRSFLFTVFFIPGAKTLCARRSERFVSSNFLRAGVQQYGPANRKHLRVVVVWASLRCLRVAAPSSSNLEHRLLYYYIGFSVEFTTESYIIVQ